MRKNSEGQLRLQSVITPASFTEDSVLRSFPVTVRRLRYAYDPSC